MVYAICRALSITLNCLLVGNLIIQDTDYNTEFSELTAKLNESERHLVFEITKAVCKTVYKSRTEK